MRRFDIFEPLPGIWCVQHRPSKSAAYIIKTFPGAVVIDTGPDATASSLMMGLQEARVGLSSVRLVALTHWHFDQSAGAAALHARSGTRVRYAEAEALFLTGQKETARQRHPKISPIAADGFVTDGEKLEGSLEAIATPGHTEGHMAYYLEARALLFAGDNFIVTNKSELEVNDETRASAARCLERPIEALLPAHGRPVTDRDAINSLRKRLRT
ncbi:MAG: MBL fold metallo-hydrolase [Acidobacteria bacterium]|nr:MAG: MBL fold metallo-hydrolase [Acidobacteriota bacterium]